MKRIYRNGRIVTGGNIIDGCSIVTENGSILSVSPYPCEDGEITDLEGRYIAPGFIDIHCHGGGGAEFIDASEDAVKTVCRTHASHGTRVMYPTVSAADYDTLFKALETVERVRENCCCVIPGVHIEGPYLSPAMAGGQASCYIRKPLREEYVSLYERFGSLIARWTYAPEEDENNEFLEYIRSGGIVASAGHTNACYEEMKNAFGRGCSLITHLYSCTSTVTRCGGFRKPGVIESAFIIKDIYAEVIADGKHLPAELLKMIADIKGTDRVCLVTDALRPGGYGREYEGKVFDDCAVPYIIEDGVAKLPDRSAFAGSIATADILLRTAVEAGFSIPESVRMLTETPAAVMGLKNYGKIAEGFKALFTVFDDELNISDYQ